MVSHNAIEIGIRWLTLSFNEPSKFYLVLVGFLGNFLLKLTKIETDKNLSMPGGVEDF